MTEESKLARINTSLIEPEYGFVQNSSGLWCCDLCSHEEVSKDEIKTHRILHFAEDHQCPICQKSFNSSTSLRNHLTVHTGIKKYRCKFCGRKFGWKTQLARHESIHTGKGLHHCNICLKSFMTKWILQRHMKVHTKHESESTLPSGDTHVEGGTLHRIAFSEACLDQLDFNQGLQQKESHNISLQTFKNNTFKNEGLIKSVYSLKNIQSSPLKAICFQCNKSFSTERGLAFHLLDHNNDSQPHPFEMQDAVLQPTATNGENVDEEMVPSLEYVNKVKSINLKNPCSKGSLTTIVSKLHHKVDDELKKTDSNDNINVQIVEASDTQFLNITLSEKRDEENKSVMSKTIDPFISGLNVSQHESPVSSTLNTNRNSTCESTDLVFLRQQIAKQNIIVNTLKKNQQENTARFEKEIQSMANKIDVLTNLVNSQSLILNKIVLGGKMTVNGMLDFTVQQTNE